MTDKENDSAVEIKYLKQLIEEITDKNNILKQNNGLLVEKCTRLEQDVNTNLTKNNNKHRYREALLSTTTTDDMASQQSKQTVLQPPTQSRLRSNSVQSTMSERSRQISHNNRVQEEEVLGNFQDYHGQKKRFKNPKRLGTGKDIDNSDTKEFVGGDRRVWLYIYRVKQEASETIIEKYLKNKPGFENLNFIVKELPTEQNNKLKAFVVVGPMEKKDELYNAEFWPKNVGISRFDFAKHKDFVSETKDFFP